MLTPILHPGDTGDDVGKLQQALVEAGEPIEQGELAAQAYRVTTQAAVEAYQRAHGLQVDGVVGARTWSVLSGSSDERFTATGWRCSPSEARPGLVEVLRQAVGLIGTVEAPPGSNRGPLIDGWNTAAGIPLGSPWCASWACSMMQLASRPIPIMGSAQKIATWGRMRGLIVDSREAVLLGDFCIILRGDGHGHVTICASDLGAGQIGTIEANSGNAIRGLIRPRSSFASIVRPMPL